MTWMVSYGVLLLLAVATAAWAVALGKRRVDRTTVTRGVMSGLVFAGGLAALAAVAALVFYRGEQPIFGVAAYVGLVVGVAFLMLGLTVMPIGLLLGGGAEWARYGAWAAVVVITVSIGFGYTAYKAFEDEQATQTPSPSPARAGATQL